MKGAKRALVRNVTPYTIASSLMFKYQVKEFCFIQIVRFANERGLFGKRLHCSPYHRATRAETRV